jgi:hypothetical protein
MPQVAAREIEILLVDDNAPDVNQPPPPREAFG